MSEKLSRYLVLEDIPAVFFKFCNGIKMKIRNRFHNDSWVGQSTNLALDYKPLASPHPIAVPHCLEQTKQISVLLWYVCTKRGAILTFFHRPPPAHYSTERFRQKELLPLVPLSLKPRSHLPFPGNATSDESNLRFTPHSLHRTKRWVARKSELTASTILNGTFYHSEQIFNQEPMPSILSHCYLFVCPFYPLSQSVAIEKIVFVFVLVLHNLLLWLPSLVLCSSATLRRFLVQLLWAALAYSLTPNHRF